MPTAAKRRASSVASVSSAGSGQPSPAVASRCSVSPTVDGARFSRRAISFREIPAVLKRSTSRTWRIAILSAGIRSPSAKAKGRPVSSQQRRRSDRHLSGRHHPGTEGEIISERRATSNRIGGRHHPGFAGDFARNQQLTRYVRADVLSGDGQGPAGLSTVKEEHQAHGRKSPRADRPSGYLAGDHKAGGSVEPGAPRMGQLL